jgi:hypothetical protein
MEVLNTAKRFVEEWRNLDPDPMVQNALQNVTYDNLVITESGFFVDLSASAVEDRQDPSAMRPEIRCIWAGEPIGDAVLHFHNDVPSYFEVFLFGDTSKAKLAQAYIR